LKILVVGASGATGRLLVEQLLAGGHEVKAIVRSNSSFPEHLASHSAITIVKGEVHNFSVDEMAHHVCKSDAVVSCLGHNLSFKGMFGSPRRLVRDTVCKVFEAVKTNGNDAPVKLILMNSTGCRNRDLNEKISFGQKVVISLLRLLLPPHADNENAIDFLRTKIGQDGGRVEWVAVRPDGLVDSSEVSDYELHSSPIRSAIFDAGKTSRINVAHFMAELITKEDTWLAWKGKMPVIYNKE
jgi:hypothetical protein